MKLLITASRKLTDADYPALAAAIQEHYPQAAEILHGGVYLRHGQEHAEAVAMGFELSALGVCLDGQQVHEAPRPTSAYGLHVISLAEWKNEAV